MITRAVPASQRMLRRILDVDSQIERAKGDDRKVTHVEQLTKVRRAYIVDLMDTLNEEESLTKRRSTDSRSSYDLAATEEWIKSHK